MNVDPVLVTAAIALLTAMGGMLLLVYRSFANGAIHPRSTIPREDYEAQVQIVAQYAERFGEQTKAVEKLIAAVEKLASR